MSAVFAAQVIFPKALSKNVLFSQTISSRILPRDKILLLIYVQKTSPIQEGGTTT